MNDRVIYKHVSGNHMKIFILVKGQREVYIFYCVMVFRVFIYTTWTFAFTFQKVFILLMLLLFVSREFFFFLLLPHNDSLQFFQTTSRSLHSCSLCALNFGLILDKVFINLIHLLFVTALSQSGSLRIQSIPRLTMDVWGFFSLSLAQPSAKLCLYTAYSHVLHKCTHHFQDYSLKVTQERVTNKITATIFDYVITQSLVMIWAVLGNVHPARTYNWAFNELIFM